VKPTIGRIVHYRSKTGNYTLPAIINCTVDTIHQPGVDAGDVPALSDERHVHLTVFTPGPASVYQEWNVPLDEVGQAPGAWWWPVVER